jgi:hypothetical protein
MSYRVPPKKAAWSVEIDIGKSCLLESTPAELHARCLATPLYVVLLDARAAGTSGRLLGATVIDLADYAYTATTPGVTSLPPEAHYGAEGFIRSQYSLLSLTGVRIGGIDASLRLRNLGSHMLSHWRSFRPAPSSSSKKTSPRHLRPSSATNQPKFVQKKKEKQVTRASPTSSASPPPDNENFSSTNISAEAQQQREREQQRARALKATINAIQLKKNARPGHDAEPHLLPNTYDDNTSSTSFTPPPLFYHNAGSPQSATSAPGGGVGNQGKNVATLDPSYSRGSPSPGTADRVQTTTSQRKQTFFGTFTNEEARRRKLQAIHEAEQSASGSMSAEQQERNAAWLRESGGGIDRKRRNQENVGPSGLSLADRRRRELQLRAMWMNQMPLTEAWEPALQVKEVGENAGDTAKDTARDTAGDQGITEVLNGRGSGLLSAAGNAMDLLDMKDSMSA